MQSSEKIIIDSYAWVEYFRGSKEGRRAKEYIDSNFSLLTPSIVIAELSDKYHRNNMLEEWKIRKLFIKFKSKILELNFEISDNSGNLKKILREKYPGAGLADAIILAHAKKEKARILTGDPHLIEEKESINIS